MYGFGFEKADSILIVISQTARDLIVKNNTELSLGENGLLQSDENGVTTRRKVFASGDVVTGARTVVEAVAVSIEEYVNTFPPKMKPY